MSQQEIDFLKKKLHRDVLNYRYQLDRCGYDCGGNLAATINPHVSKAARVANDTASALKKVDPDFPASWSPYPTGN